MASSNLCCPCPQCSETSIKDIEDVFAHINESHSSIPKYLRCAFPLCIKVFNGMGNLLVHLETHPAIPPNDDLNHQSTATRIDLPQSYSDRHTGAASGVLVPQPYTSSPATRVIATHVYSNNQRRNGELYGNTPIILDAASSPQSVTASAVQFVQYKDCANCLKRKKRCRDHNIIGAASPKRIAPRAACMGCSTDKKQCLGNAPCSRCRQLNRPCFGNDTYRAVIESVCQQLTSKNEDDIMKAIRDLKIILWIGRAEHRTRKFKRQNRSLTDANRYVLYIKECNGVQLLHSLEVHGNPISKEVGYIMREWFADEQGKDSDVLQDSNSNQGSPSFGGGVPASSSSSVGG